MTSTCNLFIIYYVNRTKVHEKRIKNTQKNTQKRKRETEKNKPKKTYKNTSRKTHHMVHYSSQSIVHMTIGNQQSSAA